jgi:hypothetical protein
VARAARRAVSTARSGRVLTSCGLPPRRGSLNAIPILPARPRRCAGRAPWRRRQAGAVRSGLANELNAAVEEVTDQARHLLIVPSSLAAVSPAGDREATTASGEAAEKPLYLPPAMCLGCSAWESRIVQRRRDGRSDASADRLQLPDRRGIVGRPVVGALLRTGRLQTSPGEAGGGHGSVARALRSSLGRRPVPGPARVSARRDRGYPPVDVGKLGPRCARRGRWLASSW